MRDKKVYVKSIVFFATTTQRTWRKIVLLDTRIVFRRRAWMPSLHYDLFWCSYLIINALCRDTMHRVRDIPPTRTPYSSRFSSKNWFICPRKDDKALPISRRKQKSGDRVETTEPADVVRIIRKIPVTIRRPQFVRWIAERTTTQNTRNICFTYMIIPCFPCG